MTFKTESEMFEPLKVYFEEKGYVVYSEVVLPGGGRADLVAADDKRIVCVEMKKSLSMDLIDQAIERKASFAYVFLAVPERKSYLPRFVERIFRKYGIGILYVTKGGQVYEKKAALYRRAFDKNVDIGSYLKPEQRNGIPGGSKGGGYVTEYSLMISRVRRYLERKNDWVELGKILEDCETHYSSPRSSLSKALRGYESSWCEMQVMNGRLHARAKVINE